MPQDIDQQFQQTQHTFNIVFLVVPVLMGLVLVVGILGVIWRVRAARSLAQSAGIDEGAATMAALSDDNAMSTMIVASRLGSPPAGHDTAARLRELESLKAQGLVTDQEYADKRAAILSGL